MRKTMLILAAAAILAAPNAARAGYTATTGERINTATPNVPPYTTPTGMGDVVMTPDTGYPTGNYHADVGEQIFTPLNNAGDFTSYTPDTIADPQNMANDLGLYHYTLNGTVQSITGNVVDYAGLYRIFYDSNRNQTWDAGDNSVSSGNFNLAATFDNFGMASLLGALNQSSGPDNPAFRDLSYGGQPVSVIGTYIADQPGVSGRINLTLRQNAAGVIPEPSSLALLATGLLPLAGFRRRRK